jgi:urea transport system ATP-binding protein
VLLGRNGVGKTTLLKSLMGLVPIKSGQVLLQGQDLSSAKPYERAAAGIGYVPQGREIFARLTVEDNLLMGLATQAGGTPIPPELFELFPVLKQMLHRRGGDLSGGQQQQLAIARALAAKPRLLILDEPSAGLSPLLVSQVFAKLREVRDTGITVLLVEQNVKSALALADRAAVLVEGRERIVGSSAELLQDERVAALYLGRHTGKQAAEGGA